jgi:hypothetical protein
MPFRLPAKPPAATLAAGTAMWRVHPHGREAIHFSPPPGRPPANRFDAPGGEYRVCYLADSPEAAFIATVVRSPDQARLVLRSLLERKDLSLVRSAADLHFALLEGHGLTRFRLSAADVADELYDACQNHALEIWRACPEIDGIQYRSRWDNARLCWAVFDRAQAKLGDDMLPPRWLGDRSVHHSLLRYYDMDVL